VESHLLGALAATPLLAVTSRNTAATSKESVMPPARRKANGEVRNGRVLEFDKDRETKGAVRFAEVPEEGKEAFVRTIYIRKELWEELKKPESIEVTIKGLS
jgi:hypothetical protein